MLLINGEPEYRRPTLTPFLVSDPDRRQSGFSAWVEKSVAPSPEAVLINRRFRSADYQKAGTGMRTESVLIVVSEHHL